MIFKWGEKGKEKERKQGGGRWRKERGKEMKKSRGRKTGRRVEAGDEGGGNERGNKGKVEFL